MIFLTLPLERTYKHKGINKSDLVEGVFTNIPPDNTVLPSK